MQMDVLGCCMPRGSTHIQASGNLVWPKHIVYFSGMMAIGYSIGATLGMVGHYCRKGWWMSMLEGLDRGQTKVL